MATRYLIMPAADLAIFDRIKFATGKATKAPHNVRYEIRPTKLKGRTEYVIPERVLDHPAFKTVHGKLRIYAVETLDDSALDIPVVEFP